MIAGLHFAALKVRQIPPALGAVRNDNASAFALTMHRRLR